MEKQKSSWLKLAILLNSYLADIVKVYSNSYEGVWNFYYFTKSFKGRDEYAGRSERKTMKRETNKVQAEKKHWCVCGVGGVI